MVLSHSNVQFGLLVWQGLGISAFYFLVVGIALHWRIRHGVRVVRYHPPDGISPAAACYLRESGATEKPFAVAILNMACKGALHIEHRAGEYLLSKLDNSVSLEPEEQPIAEDLFQSESSVRLCDVPQEQWALMVQNVLGSLESAIEPDLVSGHFPWLIPGLSISLWSVLAGVYLHLDQIWNAPGIRLIFFPLFFGVVTVLAIIKTMPATLCKIKSHLPGFRTSAPLPLVKEDFKLIYLFLAALGCLALMAWIVSWPMALQSASFLVINALATIIFRTPTAQGYVLLDQLSDFRSFLAQVDADRINRVNLPGAASPSADSLWPWALALGIEHSWGEEFAAALLNLVGLEASYSIVEQNLPEPRGRALEIEDLHLR
jgi:hypothetical protein